MKKGLLIMIFAIAMSAVPAMAQQHAPVDYVVTSTAGGKGVLTIENNSGNPCRFTVYSITGQVVRTMTVKPGSERIELQKGFYIVKSDYGSQKVVVR